jgi:hypothetical protein
MAYEFVEFIINGVSYPLNPTTIVIDNDKNVVAIYSNMGTVTITGSVSAQASTGEVVTFTITKPDGSKTTVTTATLADKTFSATYSDAAGSGYSLIGTIPADAQYQAATGPSVAFTISLGTRTITYNVA